MIIEQLPEVRPLSSAEKLIFLSELWDDLVEHPSGVPVGHEIIAELDRRMEEFREHPDRFTTWEAIQKNVLGLRS